MNFLEEKKPLEMEYHNWEQLQEKAVTTIRLCLVDDVLYHIMNLSSPVKIWKKLKSRYVSKSLMSKLYLKEKLYNLKM